MSIIINKLEYSLKVKANKLQDIDNKAIVKKRAEAVKTVFEIFCPNLVMGVKYYKNCFNSNLSTSEKIANFAIGTFYCSLNMNFEKSPRIKKFKYENKNFKCLNVQGQREVLKRRINNVMYEVKEHMEHAHQCYRVIEENEMYKKHYILPLDMQEKFKKFSANIENFAEEKIREINPEIIINPNIS